MLLHLPNQQHQLELVVFLLQMSKSLLHGHRKQLAALKMSYCPTFFNHCLKKTRHHHHRMDMIYFVIESIDCIDSSPRQS